MGKVSLYKSTHGGLILRIHETFIDGCSFHLITRLFPCLYDDDDTDGVWLRSDA